MRSLRCLLAIVSATLVAALGLLLRARAWPLGVRDEWEWLRLERAPAAIDVTLAALTVLAYSGFAALGLRFLKARKPLTPGHEALAVSALLTAAVAVQAIIPIGAPAGYGLAKWALVLHSPASTGYYTVARREIADPGRFLAAYPDWIRRQDALHVGTHPPGLFLVEAVLLRALADRPPVARWVVDHLPESVAGAFRVIQSYDPLPIADRAALGLTGALTLLACAATVVPLYLLARASLPAAGAWSAAVLWPLVPSAILFQPDADTAFPVLSVAALALAAHAGRVRAGSYAALLLAFGAGAVLALGMAFTLAFLAVGLIVALVLVSDLEVRPGRRGTLLLATGAGFLVPTLLFWLLTRANPFVIWWWNQVNHARFYTEYHRTYWLWVWINPLELAIGLGIPATVWMIAGLVRARSASRTAWATLAVLALLTLGGRNLSEVARLWLPFLPPLLTASGAGLARLGAGSASLAATIGMLGAETVLLEATIQVVYPIS
jgi:hypothetical protein